MKKKLAYSVLALGFTLAMVGCSNEGATQPSEQEGNEEKFTFNKDDIEKANTLVDKILDVYVEKQQSFEINEKEDVNNDIASGLTASLGESIPESDLDVSIAYDHDNSSGSDDFVEDPNECRSDGSIASTYKKDCELDLVFDKEKVQLNEATEVSLEELGIHALEVPFSYENKNVIDTKFTFVKTNNGTLQVVNGLGFSVLDLSKMNESAQDDEGESDIEVIQNLNLK